MHHGFFSQILSHGAAYVRGVRRGGGFRVPRSEPPDRRPECGEVVVMSSAELCDPALYLLPADEIGTPSSLQGCCQICEFIAFHAFLHGRS